MLGRHTDNIDNELQLFSFIRTGEQREACIEFNHDASKTPHINGHCVWNAKDDLRSSIESGLDIGIDFFIQETSRPKVNDFDSRSVVRFQKDILRFEIAMDNLVIV